jgi:hypothetical protein
MKLLLKYVKFTYNDKTYYRYSLSDLFQIGDYHDAGIELARIISEVIFSFIDKDNRLLIQFYHLAIIDFLKSNSIEYFAVNEQSAEKKGFLTQLKAFFTYIPTCVICSTDDRQTLYELILSLWDGHFTFHLGDRKKIPLPEELLYDDTSGAIEVFLYRTGLDRGLIMWESKNHDSLMIVTDRHHPETLCQNILSIAHYYGWDCDLHEERLSDTEKKILGHIETG